MVRYRVGVVATSPPDVTAIQEFTSADMTKFTLSPEFCNGSTYRFTVAAMDRCGRSGPALSVSRECCKSWVVVVVFISSLFVL